MLNVKNIEDRYIGVLFLNCENINVIVVEGSFCFEFGVSGGFQSLSESDLSVLIIA